MKFLVDENLPPRLANWLTARGHDALHARDIGLLGSTDAKIVATALEQDRVIVTQDKDFDDAQSRVLRICLGNAATSALVVWLEPRLDAALARIAAGERLVLVEID